MNELQVHVEKTVRPLRISQKRKLQIREELLSHLRGIYDQQIEAGKEPAEAAQTAIERFGDPQDVAPEVQKSVPWYDAPVRWCELAGPKSVAGVAFRLWIITLILFALLAGSFVLWVTSGRELIVTLLFVPVFYAILLGTICSIAGAVGGVLGHRRSNAAAVSYGIVSWGLLSLCGSFFAGDTGWVVLFVYCAIVAAVFSLMGIGMAGLLAKYEATQKTAAEWEAIDIGA